MYFMIANEDKQEYIRPVALGAKRGSTYDRTCANPGPGDALWLILLAQLIEVRGNAAPGQAAAPLNWAGDRVIILRGDDTSGTLLPDEELALVALGAPPRNSYSYVRKYFKDVTDRVLGWGPDQRFLNQVGFQLTTRPRSYDWMDPSDFIVFTAVMAEHSPDALEPYLEWLADQSGLRAEVTLLIRKQRASILLARAREAAGGPRTRKAPPRAP